MKFTSLTPIHVCYTDSVFKGPFRSFGGLSVLGFLFIRPKYQQDDGLYLHELMHYYQLRKSPFAFLFKKITRNKDFLFTSEVNAYAIQILTYLYQDEKYSHFEEHPKLTPYLNYFAKMILDLYLIPSKYQSISFIKTTLLDALRHWEKNYTPMDFKTHMTLLKRVK